MYIFLSAHRVNAKKALELAGYHPRPYGDWLREDRFGRWHAYVKNKKVIEIHFDLYVEGRHFSPIAPTYTNEEKKRIIKALKHYRCAPFDLQKQLAKL